MVVIRTSRELALMKEACRISANALKLAGTAVQPGVSGRLSGRDASLAVP